MQSQSMQNNRYLFCLLIQLVSPFFILAQNIGIHAAPVGEWTSKEAFSPEYHYNSVAVYLLNEDKILDLFNPTNLTREQRKQTGVKNFDIIESLYFSLQLTNPRQENDIIDFPLYAFDIHNSKSFQVPRNQGKILDRITDEELNGRRLEANAKIEAVKKNQMLEVAYQISSSINKILVDQIFNNPGISGVMRKAQSFFEDKYRGKIVSEFTVPILPGNEDFEYRLHSASIYQIKWDFQDPVKVFKNNMWSDLKEKNHISEKNLSDRPSHSSRFKKYPFLVVVRYKSAYSLPEAHKLNVALDAAYLEKRLFNLQEFRKNGHQYHTESAFLALLREAIDLKRNCENYRRAKDKGQEENELLLHIAQQNYELLNAYKKEVTYNQTQPTRLDYFKANYDVAYYKFFKQIDNILFQDQQLQAIGNVPAILAELEQTDLTRLPVANLYEYLKKLAPYREIAAKVNQVEGDLFYKIREQINLIESVFQPQVFNVPAFGDKQKRIDKLNELIQLYPYCKSCLKETKTQLAQIQQSINDERRTQLFALQNQQLKYRQCFSDLQIKSLLQLQNRYPNSTDLSELEQALYHSFLTKINNLEKIAGEFQGIEKVSIEKLAAENLLPTLAKYEGILNQYQNEICQLYHGELLAKEDMSCLGRTCKIAVP